MTMETSLQNKTNIHLSESQLWPKGFQSFLDGLSPISQKEKEQRQKRIIIYGDFDYKDEFQQLLIKLGYLGVPSKYVYWGNIGKQDEDLDVGFCRQWPRNACTRFGDTIVHRASLNPAIFSDNLKHFFPNRLYSFLTSDEWANGGSVLTDHTPIILPSQLMSLPFASQLPGTEGVKVLVPFPAKEIVSHKIENDSSFRKKYGQETINSWNNRFITNAPVDLDLFMSTFCNRQKKVFLAVDELYVDCYPVMIKELAKFYTILPVDYMEAGNLSCNFIQLPGDPGVVLIPGPSPKTKQLIAQQIGVNSVLELPLTWFTDSERSGAIRCRTNIL